jgi:hypothetical protein
MIDMPAPPNPLSTDILQTLTPRSGADTLIAMLIGLFAGVLSGLIGIGGGLIIVPLSVVLLHKSQHVAQGTSLAVIVPAAIVGVLVYMHGGNVNFKVATPIAIAAVPFAIISATFVSRVPAYHLKVLFFAVVAADAVKLFFFT